MTFGAPELTVILPTHNPDAARLAAALAGLAAQTLPAERWETLVIDNASAPAVRPATAPLPSNVRVLREPQLGLSAARRTGFAAARGEVAVLVDDDNVLAPDYLAHVLELFAAHPAVGVLGGKSLPQFAVAPDPWTREFHPLLALRDLGPAPLLSRSLRPAGAARQVYPSFAPIGAGMALRRGAWMAWVNARRAASPLTDRRGDELTSGGDNDIVFCAMAAHWEAAYFPALTLTHLIPAARLTPAYLARLNYAVQKSWMQVLALHDASPWPPLSRAGAAARRLKAWFTHRAWTSPAAHIRWRGACGHFDGRVQP